MRVNPDPPPQAGSDPGAGLPWYRGLSGHHWFVLIVCWLGWFFDTLDQQLFILARNPAMMDLLGPGATRQDAIRFGSIATTVLILGWATGGIVFGILGDRWGRAKTLVTAVFFYSVFTGLSALSVTWVDFSAYRFLTGMGVGGTFAAAVALVAETLPARSRPYALGFLQSLAAVGNMSAAGISFLLPPSLEIHGVAGWRLLFAIGIVPAVLVLFVMRRLKEPESWLRAREARARGETAQTGQKMGSLRELFGDPRWRRNVLVGIALGLAGIMGLWGIGFWLPELVREVVKDPAKSDRAVSLAMVLFNGGAAVATYGFTLLMGRVGRRPAFAAMFLVAIATVAGVFGFMSRPDQVWWMAIVLGVGTLTIFGGYSIYFPELFPTRLRATGTGFCYNTARYVAAAAPSALAALTGLFAASPGSPRAAQGLSELTLLSGLGGVDSPFRYAAIVVSSVFLLGLVALFFAPETRGKPLPE